MQLEFSNTQDSKLHKQILKICHSLDLSLHFNRKGPKIFTNYQRVALIILYKRAKKSLVDFVKELYESLWPNWLGLREIPGKSTLHDWLKLFELPVVKLLHEAVIEDQKPELMAIDGTGIDSHQRSRHYERRIGEPHMPYAKLDIFIDVKTLIIHDHELRMKPRHDALIAKQLMKRTKLRGVKILGDKGYDSEPLHKIVQEKGNLLYAPTRNSSRKTPKGQNRKRCAQKDEDYPMRNTVESTIHILKHRIIQTLKSKIHYMKKREMAWTIILHNITRIIEQTKIYIKIIITYSG